MYIDSLGNARNDKGQIICARCYKVTNVTTMSWFNTQMICSNCRKQEENDPRIKQAKEMERQAVL